MNPVLRGHLLALAAVLIWGMTFISSKVLVGILDPCWYIVLRFLIAWAALFLLSPRPLGLLSPRREARLILSGLVGVTLYYIFQNVALQWSTASNTGVITASSPLFTALILWAFGRRVRLSRLFFLGFLLCIGGVAVISFRGTGAAGLHVLGDAFAVGSAVAWGAYCVIILKNEGSGLTQVQLTRKIFFWGVLLTLPPALVLGRTPDLSVLTGGGTVLWGNLLFVSLFSSALCYLIWGQATELIGAVTTSVYLYLIPVVSVIGSALILRERVDLSVVLAIAAILVGLVFSQKGNRPAEPEGDRQDATG